ncbi:hypothetical protein [Halococcus sp. PRR34]|uniref:hypothetical protein n=1 Tax=Halococcus sp. PRR34 TaxID=3020830 RepID=UPI00236135F2|nr:hypothetical protein [Halococcus sp. PRR34]
MSGTAGAVPLLSSALQRQLSTINNLRQMSAVRNGSDEDDIGEDRAFSKLDDLLTFVVDLGAGDVGGEEIRRNWSRENERSSAVAMSRAVLGTAVAELGRERRPNATSAGIKTNERPIPTVRGPALWTKNDLIHITLYVILAIRILRESKILRYQPNSYVDPLPALPA